MRQANRLGGAEQLRTKIWNRTYEKTDHRRGALLVLVMNVSIGVAVGVAVAYLAHLYWLGWSAGIITFLIGSIRLGYIVCVNAPKS